MGRFFKLATTVLSNETEPIFLDCAEAKIDNDLQYKEYAVFPEFTPKDIPLALRHIHAKKWRVNAAIYGIKKKKDEICSTSKINSDVSMETDNQSDRHVYCINISDNEEDNDHGDGDVEEESVVDNEIDHNVLRGTNEIRKRNYNITPAINELNSASVGACASSLMSVTSATSCSSSLNVLVSASNDNTTNTVTNSASFYNYFVGDLERENAFDNGIIGNLVKPSSCRPTSIRDHKNPCSRCRVSCSYTMEAVLHPTNSISQPDILKELSLHGHPKSKNITVDGTSRGRLTHEAARELADHYIYAHNKFEPAFLPI